MSGRDFRWTVIGAGLTLLWVCLALLATRLYE
jgi:hypothetical protein